MSTSCIHGTPVRCYDCATARVEHLEGRLAAAEAEASNLSKVKAGQDLVEKALGYFPAHEQWGENVAGHITESEEALTALRARVKELEFQLNNYLANEGVEVDNIRAVLKAAEARVEEAEGEAAGFKTAWESELLLRGEAETKLGAALHDGYMDRCRGDVLSEMNDEFRAFIAAAEAELNPIRSMAPEGKHLGEWVSVLVVSLKEAETRANEASKEVGRLTVALAKTPRIARRELLHRIYDRLGWDVPGDHAGWEMESVDAIVALISRGTALEEIVHRTWHAFEESEEREDCWIVPRKEALELFDVLPKEHPVLLSAAQEPDPIRTDLMKLLKTATHPDMECSFDPSRWNDGPTPCNCGLSDMLDRYGIPELREIPEDDPEPETKETR